MADICVKFEGLSDAQAGTKASAFFSSLKTMLARQNYRNIPEPQDFNLQIDAALFAQGSELILEEQFDPAENANPGAAVLRNYAVVVTAAVAGSLWQSGISDAGGTGANPSKIFVDSVTQAVSEISLSPKHFFRVANFLMRTGSDGTSSLVRPAQLAEVARRLIADRRDPSDPYFDAYVQSALATVLGGGVDRRAVALEISLPDLEDETGGDVVKDNVAACAAIYFTAMLEEHKLFTVADRVAQEFVDGRIPVSKSNGGQAIFDYFKGSVNRLTEAERRGMYARTFGVAQGNVEVAAPNREFNDLWIRFLSSVSYLKRQTEHIQITRVTEQQAFKAARDLAVNLSLHGYGMVHFAAIEFQNHIAAVKKMLSYPDVIAAYGARDIWQLVERVSDLSLGGAVNGVRQRTLARAGGDIILWLSSKSTDLSSNRFQGFLAGSNPETEALVRNVESWLAMTGTRDETVEQFSSPVEIRQQSTIPQLFSMPSMQGVQDALKNSMQQLGMNGARMPQA